MTNGNHSDPVESAMSVLRDRRPSSQPPNAICDATRRRLNDLDRSADSGFKSMLGRMRGSRAMQTLVAACVLLVVLFAWPGLSGHVSSVAFADVKEQLARVRTVRFVNTRLADVSVDDLEPLDAPVVQGVRKARSFRVLGSQYQPQITLIKGRYLQRVETLGADSAIESVTITDLEHGKLVMINCKAKSFTELNQQVTVDSETNRATSAPVTPKVEADLFAQIAEIPGDATTQLPQRTLAGKTVIGFFWQQKRELGKGMTDIWERTYWVDPNSKLPVRIEVSYYSTDPSHKSTEWVLSGFVFDQDIADAEFSMVPPAGYKQSTGAIMNVELH
jgi:hypothetical protein